MDVAPSIRERKQGDRENPKRRFLQKNRRISQIQPFSWKFQHLEGAGNRRFSAENRRFSQQNAGNRRLGSVTLGPSPLAWPQIILSGAILGIRYGRIESYAKVC